MLQRQSRSVDDFESRAIFAKTCRHDSNGVDLLCFDILLVRGITLGVIRESRMTNGKQCKGTLASSILQLNGTTRAEIMAVVVVAGCMQEFMCMAHLYLPCRQPLMCEAQDVVISNPLAGREPMHIPLHCDIHQLPVSALFLDMWE
jgi:hypothetical protein